MSFAPPLPPIFAGDNYHIWVVKMKTYLQAIDLWSAVESDVEPPPLRENPTIAQIRQHDKTRQQQVINLRKEFENLKMKESETIKQYSDRIMATVNNIRLLGEDFSDSRMVKKRRASRQEENPEGAFQAKAREGSSSNQKAKKPWFERRDKAKKEANKEVGRRRFPPCIHYKNTNHLEKFCWTRPDIQCKSCKQYGHHEKICRNHEKAQVQPIQAKTAEDIQAQEEHVFTASCFAINNKCSWLVDSGC
ncbi:uncharacterized protein [Gossypium hirsutum]|uniref:DUF4219 domain-containing protein n=1 Tax=Gossypium hirsutum TaxID=3635 RepID=A0A1U8N5B3_GOSHI|nr:uncharacterized protein LOC107943749 [Gossypium hirsutum]